MSRNATDLELTPVTSNKSPRWLRNLRADTPIHIVMLIGLAIAITPLAFMVFISLKSMGQFMTQPLAITFPLEWSNYVIAWNVLKRSIFNTTGMAAVVVTTSLITSSLAAYVFARFEFPGRESLYWTYLAVLFIPNILTFTTRYTLVRKMGILDTYAVQIVPYVAHAQIFQTVILRSFFAGIPTAILDSARVDGANVFQVFLRIVLPMSRPILATLAVMRVLGFWNEWLWPMVTVQSRTLRPLGLQVYYLQSDVGGHVGRQMAGYVIASIPLLVLFSVASKQFVEGLTSGAVKF